MQLLSFSTENLYVSLSALIKDEYKIVVCQGYNIVKKDGNRKNKNGNLRKICLRYILTGKLYQENRTSIKYQTCGKKKKCTDSFSKPYTMRKDLA